VHVTKPGTTFLDNPSEGDALEYLFGIAKAHNADMTLVRSSDVVNALVRQARKKAATHIILGVTNASTTSAGTIEAELARALPDAHIIAVPA
jgi:K+-sensing histidine kinase KdpD